MLSKRRMLREWIVREVQEKMDFVNVLDSERVQLDFKRKNAAQNYTKIKKKVMI